MREHDLVAHRAQQDAGHDQRVQRRCRPSALPGRDRARVRCVASRGARRCRNRSTTAGSCRAPRRRRPPATSAFHSSAANVAPVTSSDSPSAMITNSAQRSARWRAFHVPVRDGGPAEARHPEERDRRDRIRSPAPAPTRRSAHRASARPPAIQHTADSDNHDQDALEVARMCTAVAAHRPQEEQRAPDLHRRVRAPRTAARASRTLSGSTPTAAGPRASARTAHTRTGMRSGSSQLVTHEVLIQTHQIAEQQQARLRSAPSA